jgi:putative chitinase
MSDASSDTAEKPNPDAPLVVPEPEPTPEPAPPAPEPIPTPTPPPAAYLINPSPVLFERDTFFHSVRASVFSGHLSQAQVDGCNSLLLYWEAAHAVSDKRWLAYAMATAYHETDHTMQPIAEVGEGAGHSYGEKDPDTGQVYYGRGYVQLTWKGNYAKQAKMHPEYAAAILFSGMIAGDFTGKTLWDYFNTNTDDPVDARRIINGTDCAEMIAGYYQGFIAALDPAVA